MKLELFTHVDSLLSGKLAAALLCTILPNGQTRVSGCNKVGRLRYDNHQDDAVAEQCLPCRLLLHEILFRENGQLAETEVDSRCRIPQQQTNFIYCFCTNTADATFN